MIMKGYPLLCENSRIESGDRHEMRFFQLDIANQIIYFFKRLHKYVQPIVSIINIMKEKQW